MSSRRARKRDEGDGLELLLDVVANLFGGVTLIAILIAILTGEETHRVSEGPDAQAAYDVLKLKGDVRKTVQRRQFLVEAVTDAQLTLEALEATSDSAATTILTRIERELVDETAAFVRDQEKLSVLRERARTTGSISEIVEQEIETLSVTMRTLKVRTEELEATRSPAAKLPQRGLTNAKTANVAIQGGKLFIAYGPNDEEINTDAVYMYSGEKGALQTSVQISFKPGGGVPIDENLLSQPRWQQIRSWFPPNEWYFELSVSEDSYEEFLTLRHHLTLAGYRYQIIRRSVGDPYVLVWALHGPRPID